MTWPTHTVFGISTLWLLTLVPPEELNYNFGTLAGCATLGALLPDLDAAESKIKHVKILGTNIQPFRLPAQVVQRSEPHRGLLHSLAGVGMVCLMAAPAVWWVRWAPVGALLLGYVSHLVTDAMTKSGLRLLYPQPKRFHLLPKAWRITTGSLAEEALLLPLAFLVMILLLRQLLLDAF